jgi:Dyp-type peroxidase family
VADELEPVLAIDEIQGNIFGGFNKPHQALVCLHLPTGEAELARTRRWLKELAPRLTSLREVAGYKKVRRLRLMELGERFEPEPVVWTNIAFSYQGLRKLTDEADAFDATFRNGLSAGESASLGDPTDPQYRGHISHWVVGGTGDVPDALAIIAADLASELDQATGRFRKAVEAAGATCTRVDLGHDPSHYNAGGRRFPRGREHFGFEDGVSQPGIRGRLSAGADDFLTPRPADGGDPDRAEFSAPGQPLICPGEFILGYPRQSSSFPRLAAPGWPLGPKPYAPDPNARAPYWARDGSFLVYRRLRQDVSLFNRFLEAESARLAQLPALGGLTEEALGALLVGRWRSGAPVVRSPKQDNALLGQSPGANNAFMFDDVDDPKDGFPPPVADPFGRISPQSAHIRKVNPRDLDTDDGAATRTLNHRILRRGIPYGVPLPIGETQDDGADRGLLFLCYQSSIADQFHFLAARWMNDSSKPSQLSPPGGSGFDMVVGQNPDAQAQRRRFICLGVTNDRCPSTVGAAPEWVIPTGGGYFFAPSRTTIRAVLGAA